jgi:hypothetical protein
MKSTKAWNQKTQTSAIWIMPVEMIRNNTSRSHCTRDWSVDADNDYNY